MRQHVILLSRVILVWLLQVQLFVPTTQAQGVDRNAIERSVLDHNNRKEYAQSQQLLLKQLEFETLSDNDRFFVLLQLSYTYKRLFDYPTVLKFLDEAQQVALRSKQRDSLLAVVQSQLAFTLFDTHSYQAADSIMNRLAASEFNFVPSYEVAILQMQEAYIRYLDKDYVLAKTRYVEAKNLMAKASPCDVSNILVKQMQLFDVMGLRQASDVGYEEALHLADSCGIVKYRLYAMEERLQILRNRNEIQNAFALQADYDALVIAYNAGQGLSELHLQRQDMLEKQREAARQGHIVTRSWLLFSLGAVVVLVALGAVLFVAYRKRRKRLEIEYLDIKRALDHYIQLSERSAEIAKEESDIQAAALTTRQLEVMQLLVDGFSNKEIATKLFMSENTVKFHIKGIYKALGISDRKALLSQAQSKLSE